MGRSGGGYKRTRTRLAITVLAFWIGVLKSYGQVAGEHPLAAQPSQASLESSTPSQAAVSRPLNIGLALEGGGALGIAHVGVLKWMNEHRVPITSIAGTSMGALVGSLIASGNSEADIEQLIRNGSFDDLFTTRPSLRRISLRRREDREELPQAISFGLRTGLVPLGTSLITDNRLNALIAHELVAYNSESLAFDNLPIPFRCVATDLTTLKPFVFSSGSLPFAVRASISIPGVFPPVYKDGDILVDGAIVDNLPTDVLREDLHADVVIAVHLADGAFGPKEATSLFAVFARAFQAGTNRNEQIGRAAADIEILPEVGPFSSSDYGKAAELVKAGYDATEEQKARLLPYALSAADWAIYRDSLEARRRQPPGLIKAVRIEGPSAAVSARLARNASGLQGQQFDASRAEAAVAEARSNDALDAYYETFRTSQPVQQQATLPEPDDGVLLHWRPKLGAPPYLLLGADVVAMSSNVTNTVFDLRFIDQNAGGYGSEIRSDLRLGYLTNLSGEYYKPLGSRGFFLQPHLSFLKQPVYLWEDQRRISERLLQRGGGRFDAGWTFNNNLEIAAEYRASTLLWQLKEGLDHSPTPYVSGKAESAAVHLKYNSRTAEIAAPQGSQLEMVVGHLFKTTASTQAPFLNLNARHLFTIQKKNALSISAQADTYFRHDVADPLRFALGGPLRLYASSIDEYRGTDTLLARVAYLRRVSSLPTGLGQGLYFAGGYEAGNVWSPEQRTFLREDIFGGVLCSTPFGAVTLGGAVGDAGHRKVFVTFGKLF